MQLCIVSFCLAFRFNRFVQIPSHPLIEFARHGKLDTVCLSRCRNMFSPLEWVVSCAGGQLKFWPSLLNLSQAMVMHPSYGSWRNQDTICPEQLMSLSSLSTRTCLWKVINWVHCYPASKKKPKGLAGIYRNAAEKLLTECCCGHVVLQELHIAAEKNISVCKPFCPKWWCCDRTVNP